MQSKLAHLMQNWDINNLCRYKEILKRKKEKISAQETANRNKNGQMDEQ